MTQTTVNNNRRAAKYLQLFRPKGFINLVAIHPETEQLSGITRDSKSPDLLKFIEKNAGICNLYYMVNEPTKDAPNNKLTKDHVSKVHALFIDADPDKDKPFEKERVRLKNFIDELNNDKEFQPSYIIDSGGGYQAFWLFEGNISTKEAEDYNRGLIHKYKTDKIHNVDRIMRLPFTFNLPTKKKKTLGRTAQLATVIYASKKIYKWDELKNICTPKEAEEYKTKIDYDDLDMSMLEDRDSRIKIKQKFKEELNKSPKLRAIFNKEIKKPSRSEYDFLLAQQLKMSGWTLQETAQAMYIFPHGKGKELTAREITRAYNRVSNPIEGFAVPNAEEIMAQPNPLLLNAPNTAEKKTDPLNQFLTKRLTAYHTSQLDWKSTGKPLVKGLIDQHSLTVMYGQSNVGKSFVALDIATHIAMGKDWGNYKIPQKKAVLYVFAEAGGSAGKRIKAVRKRLNIPKNASPKDFPFFAITMGINLLEKPTNNRDDVNDIIILCKKFTEETGYEVGLVVVDTLSTTFAGGNENSSEDMGAFITNCKQVQEKANTAVLIVHHAGKDQAAGARGHSSLRAATDTELEIKSEKQGNRYLRELIVKKQRDGETGTKIKFGLNVIELGVDDENDPITSCNVVLEGDHEFEAIMPSAIDSLNEEHKRLYFAIYIAQKTSNGHQSMVNAWLDYLIREKTPLEQSVMDKLVKEKPITHGIQNDEVSAKKSTLINWRQALLTKGVVESTAVSSKPGDVIWSIV